MSTIPVSFSLYETDTGVILGDSIYNSIKSALISGKPFIKTYRGPCPHPLHDSDDSLCHENENSKCGCPHFKYTLKDGKLFRASVGISKEVIKFSD